MVYMCKKMIACLFFVLTVTKYSHGASQPHILFVLADDYGFNDIGYHGSEIRTPILNKLAMEGVRLENYYVQPICTPTRSTLMSGRHQIHTGLQHGIIASSQPNALPRDSPTLADKMKESGYATHAVGKWHLGFYKIEYMPNNRGFDTHFGYLTGSEDYVTHINDRGYSGYDLRENFKPVNITDYSTHMYTKRVEDIVNNYNVSDDSEDCLRSYYAGCGMPAADGDFPGTGPTPYFVKCVTSYRPYIYSTHMTCHMSMDFNKLKLRTVFLPSSLEFNVSDESDKPLFIYLALQAVHSPLEVPSYYTDQYRNIYNKDRRTYAGMVSAMDEAVGNITNLFKAKGIWDNTVMVFSTDNGGLVGAGGNNWPLRGWKRSLWEGGMRGVGFVHSERLNHKIKGSVSTELIHVSDWYPTLVSLAGGNLNGTLPLDGYDQWTTISEGLNGPRDTLLHNIDPLTAPVGKRNSDIFDNRVRAALRFKDWKIITGDPGNGSWIPEPGFSEKTIISREDPVKNLWLFNIKKDPNEYVDLSDRYPEIVNQLLGMLQKFNQTAVPCRYPDSDPRADPKLNGGFWGPWQ